MAKRKNKTPDVSKLKENIKKAKKETPEHVDWKLCAETVDSLHGWINDLCVENHKLKKLLQHVIEKLKEDNAQTKKILQGLEPRFKKFDDGSKDIPDS
jgi:DNA-binding transcriptional regulator GbsR (MarR family)